MSQERQKRAETPKITTTKLLPAIILFDFCAAFPSVAHELILMICKAMGSPEGLLNYLKFLYEGNQCLYRGDDSDTPLYRVDSGIIQGCPLSGAIFVMTVDPCLRLLQKTLPSSTNRAFADVIATIVQSLQDLSTLKSNFDIFRDISGLDLKIKNAPSSLSGSTQRLSLSNASREPSNKSSRNGPTSPLFPPLST